MPVSLVCSPFCPENALFSNFQPCSFDIAEKSESIDAAEQSCKAQRKQESQQTSQEEETERGTEQVPPCTGWFMQTLSPTRGSFSSTQNRLTSVQVGVSVLQGEGERVHERQDEGLADADQRRADRDGRSRGHYRPVHQGSFCKRLQP